MREMNVSETGKRIGRAFNWVFWATVIAILALPRIGKSAPEPGYQYLLLVSRHQVYVSALVCYGFVALCVAAFGLGAAYAVVLFAAWSAGRPR